MHTRIHNTGHISLVLRTTRRKPLKTDKNCWKLRNVSNFIAWVVYFGTLFSLPVYNFFDKNNVGRQILTRGDCNCLGIMRGFPGSTDGKESACNGEDLSSIPGLERFPGEGDGYPLQYSCLENPMEGGPVQSTGSQWVGHDWTTNPYKDIRNGLLFFPLPAFE